MHLTPEQLEKMAVLEKDVDTSKKVLEDYKLSLVKENKMRDIFSGVEPYSSQTDDTDDVITVYFSCGCIFGYGKESLPRFGGSDHNNFYVDSQYCPVHKDNIDATTVYVVCYLSNNVILNESSETRHKAFFTYEEALEFAETCPSLFVYIETGVGTPDSYTRLVDIKNIRIY